MLEIAVALLTAAFSMEAFVSYEGRRTRVMGSLGDVTGVFFGRDFVSVTSAPGVGWSDLKPDVLGILMDHFLAGVPLFNAASAAGQSPRSSTRTGIWIIRAAMGG